jgi:hypothetical protein
MDLDLSTPCSPDISGSSYSYSFSSSLLLISSFFDGDVQVSEGVAYPISCA